MLAALLLAPPPALWWRRRAWRLWTGKRLTWEEEEDELLQMFCVSVPEKLRLLHLAAVRHGVRASPRKPSNELHPRNCARKP